MYRLGFTSRYESRELFACAALCGPAMLAAMAFAVLSENLREEKIGKGYFVFVNLYL